jgi:hypothetical protein
MPKVFVHGNPETDAIWSELVDRLSDASMISLTDWAIMSSEALKSRRRLAYSTGKVSAMR